ncbi:MAG TPA: hypothetical protein VNZ49_09290 [Bacteroidia bacterium]|nr:hypothetical protein [Bacteroidia bacterium]
MDKIGNKDMATVSGGLNYNGIFYASDGINNRRSPYSWFFNGNVTVNILNISLPFTYSYSNLSSSYTQPFNMAGCAPTYKWVKTYLGYTSMNFSNYTLAGHIFLGAGAEFSPKNWKICGMYGRLKKVIEYNVVTQSDELMSYQRMGYGAKVGYEKNGYGFNLIYFSAKDNPASLKFTPSNTIVLAQENTVVSINGKTKISKLFTLEAEYALSGLTRNLQSDAIISTPQTNKLPLLFSMNSTSQFFSAYKSSFGFSKNIFSLAVNYEYISPDYKTLGAYYFNNDLENITLSPSLRLLKGKLNISVNGGYQHNNLDHSKFSTNKRFITSGNVAFMPNQKFSLTAMYSNFSTYTNVRPIADPYYQKTAADTLNFYQISQSSNATCSYNLSRTVLRHTFVLTSSYQVSNQKQGSLIQPSTKVLNGNFCYNLSFIKSKWSSGLTYNYNQIQNFINTTIYMGPGITIGKSFAHNLLRLNITNIFNQAYNNQKVTALVLSERASLSFTPKIDKKYGKPSVSLSAMYTNKFKTDLEKNVFKEFTGMVNLNYSF